MQENHAKYSKLCVYWIGPFIPWVFTADVEIMKLFLRQPGGKILIAINFTVLPCMYDNALYVSVKEFVDSNPPRSVP